jgi:hypothetical protein
MHTLCACALRTHVALQVQQSMGFKLPVVPLMDASAAAVAQLDEAQAPPSEHDDESEQGSTSSALAEASLTWTNPLYDAENADQRLLFANPCTMIKPGHVVPGWCLPLFLTLAFYFGSLCV